MPFSLRKYANRERKRRRNNNRAFEKRTIISWPCQNYGSPKSIWDCLQGKKGHTDRKLHLMRAGSRSSFLFVAAMTTTRLSCSNPSIYKTYIFSNIERCSVWN
jgi:hypothetical protein